MRSALLAVAADRLDRAAFPGFLAALPLVGGLRLRQESACAAAIVALGGLPNIDVFVLHPKGRVSDVQRRQMTTSPHKNVHNIALEGTFDDCQAIVKALFAEAEFAKAVNLTAVNGNKSPRLRGHGDDA